MRRRCHRQRRAREDVGGGVSQFATTTFNAAFFAGLDIDEYQAHTELHLAATPTAARPRWPIPSPDLKFTNNTPTGS